MGTHIFTKFVTKKVCCYSRDYETPEVDNVAFTLCTVTWSKLINLRNCAFCICCCFHYYIYLAFVCSCCWDELWGQIYYSFAKQRKKKKILWQWAILRLYSIMSPRRARETHNFISCWLGLRRMWHQLLVPVIYETWVIMSGWDTHLEGQRLLQQEGEQGSGIKVWGRTMTRTLRDTYYGQLTKQDARNNGGNGQGNMTRISRSEKGENLWKRLHRANLSTQRVPGWKPWGRQAG